MELTIDAVVIGRNEGQRLIACLNSLQGQVRRIIYVDSGSIDGSVAAARGLNAEVVELDMSLPFTAARARNAGLAVLDDTTDLVQFVDGDCEVVGAWIGTARAFLANSPQVAVVCGRRREKYPEVSIYNQMCDDEWDTPTGQTKACGGDALMRYPAVRNVGGYRDDLIAGEEPELCLRLRKAGWQVWRLDQDMTLHDADMKRFSQWWRRTKRSGFAFAQGTALHGAPPERHWVTETRRSLFWGVLLPSVLILGGGLLSPWLWLGLLAYPAQVVRLSSRSGVQKALYTVLGKFAEGLGVMQFYWLRLRGVKAGIIEYK